MSDLNFKAQMGTKYDLFILYLISEVCCLICSEMRVIDQSGNVNMNILLAQETELDGIDWLH